MGTYILTWYQPYQLVKITNISGTICSHYQRPMTRLKLPTFQESSSSPSSGSDDTVKITDVSEPNLSPSSGMMIWLKNYRRFGDHFRHHHQSFMIWLKITEVSETNCPHHLVPETSVIFSQLTRLLPRDDSINFSRCEIFSFLILRLMSVEQLMEWELVGRTEVLWENLPQCHAVHHKSYMTLPEIDESLKLTHISSW
jgi:hypothetical protein